jgi:hypothetical protein
MLKIAGVDIDINTDKTDYNGMTFAFGPKILLDPLFAITLDEIRIKFMGQNKISSDASLIIAEKDVFF